LKENQKEEEVEDDPDRWINDVEDDLKKLGVKRWRTTALDREEWVSIVREAKAKLKGP